MTDWNRNNFGNIFKKKRIILARLAGLQKSSHYPTSTFLQNLEIDLNRDFNHLLTLEEEFWKLKSRISWLNDGNANANFFHLSTLKRRRRNRISALKDSNGNWNTDPTFIHTTVLQFYEHLYTTKSCSLY